MCGPLEFLDTLKVSGYARIETVSLGLINKGLIVKVFSLNCIMAISKNNLSE